MIIDDNSAGKDLHKLSALLLFGIGLSRLGDFIYLVAINIMVLQLTGSPAAVAGLWIIAPIASILTKFWAGSFVDRFNKKTIMIWVDLIRALFVAAIPLFSSIWVIYILLFFLAVSKAFFEPASITYITKLIPQKFRKRFNSLQSLITSGAFVVGPAIAGGLLFFSSVNVAIWINAFSFFISAVVLVMLPNVDREGTITVDTKVGLQTIREDWEKVMRFCREQKYVVFIYSLVQVALILALGMDTQEVVFTQQILHLKESDYGLLITITGIGYIAGAAFVSAIQRKLSIKTLMGIGFPMVAVGYIIYAFSFSFWSVAIGFIILGFFNAFSNTGFMTFFQNNVPVEMMGRISSVFGSYQSIFQVIFILLIGFTGEILPLRTTIIIASAFNLWLTCTLIFLIYKPSKKNYYVEENITA